MKRVLLCAAVAACAAAPAFAETGLYGSAGYTHIVSSEEFNGENIDMGALSGQVGMMLNDNFGVEVEAAVGVRDFDDRVSGVQIVASLEYAIAAYGRAQVEVGDNITVFARAGFAQAEIEVEASAFSIGQQASSSDSGFAGGIGADFMLTERVGLTAGYTRHEVGEGFNTFNIGAKFKF